MVESVYLLRALDYMREVGDPRYRESALSSESNLRPARGKLKRGIALKLVPSEDPVTGTPMWDVVKVR